MTIRLNTKIPQDITVESILAILQTLETYSKNEDTFYKGLLLLVHPDNKEKIDIICKKINQHLEPSYSRLIEKDSLILSRRLLF